MVYIKILKKFRNIHNKDELYEESKIYEVSQERYEEIIKNMKKKNLKLIRKATKKEIEELNIEQNNIEEIEE